MKGIFKCLPDGFFSFAGLFDLNEVSWFGWRMAKSKINTTLPGFVFRPDHRGVERVPSEILQHPQNYALRNCLLIWKSSLPKTNCDI